jgi:ubiquinol oxidase
MQMMFLHNHFPVFLLFMLLACDTRLTTVFSFSVVVSSRYDVRTAVGINQERTSDQINCRMLSSNLKYTTKSKYAFQSPTQLNAVGFASSTQPRPPSNSTEFRLSNSLPTVTTSIAAAVAVASPTSTSFTVPVVNEQMKVMKVMNTNTVATTAAVTIASAFGRPLDPSTMERNQVVVRTLKSFLFDTLFQGKTMERSYARFYALETIARMPYFSYLSVLHLFETLGFWRQADLLKIHFSESWNELHHLLIMESLGGNDQWQDRFVAQHIAVFYYWIVVTLYLYNPTLAYNLNQAVEEEAYATYDKFLQTHQDELQQLPAPAIAIKYYTSNDLYLFDAMHTSTSPKVTDGMTTGSHDVSKENVEEQKRRRRPDIQSLYDVFVAIRDDEMEHAKTMKHFQQ